MSVLDFKSATLYTVRLVLHSADTDELIQALAARMQEAGSFFENETVVIDAGSVDGVLDWARLLKALKQHKLRPLGITAGVSANKTNLKAAQKQGLVEVELSAAKSTEKSKAEKSTTEKAAERSADKPAASKQADNTPAVPSAPAMIVNRQLRSGQRLYAQHADLIITGVVSQGAEIIADGNIHVYGALRGKAMAGARGNPQARIFSTDFNPELVAVAGVYQVLESQLDERLHRKACMVRLDGQSLHISPLGEFS